METGHELLRIGPQKDGGYLIPDDLDDIKYCFSPGVAAESRFEYQLAELGIEVFMADGSVDMPKLEHQKFTFSKHHIGSYPRISGGIEYKSLPEWTKSVTNMQDRQCDCILQMDIEGYEYEVIYNLDYETQEMFRIIVLELHNLQHLQSQFGFNLISRAIDKLLSTHEVVHLHPNNSAGTFKVGAFIVPRLLEVTFLRKDRVKSAKPVKQLPHRLDCECDTRRPSIPLKWNQ